MRARVPTSEALEEAMDPQLLLIGHEQDQPHRGHAHPWVSTDGQLADSFIEEQVDGVVIQRQDKAAARIKMCVHSCDSHFSSSKVCVCVCVTCWTCRPESTAVHRAVTQQRPHWFGCVHSGWN